MIVEDFDSKAFEIPTEKMSNTVGLQIICDRMQKYVLAMSRAAKNIEESSFEIADKVKISLQNASELIADYNTQFEIFSEWVNEETLVKANQVIEVLLEQMVPMNLEERIDFLSSQSLYIDYKNCDIEDVARQHGADVAEFVKGAQLRSQQQQMQEEMNALIYGGSVSASGQDNFIQLTQKHEDELILRKKAI